MIQQELLNRLQKSLSNNTSIIDAVTEALDISYDAAHRRTSLKSKFSLEESIRLARHYNLSLDSLYSIGNSNLVTVEKTASIQYEDDLEQYFETSYTSLQLLLKQKEATIIYSAKDIPLFYTLNNPLLNRFKIYAWLKILNSNFSQKKFNEFQLKPSLVTASEKLGTLYKNVNITEIWDITTINSTLKQVHFYFQTGLLDSNTALEICSQLKAMMSIISKKVTHSNINYQLYYNELLLMNNNVLVKTPTIKTLYVPFTILSYYKTSDIKTCEEASNYFDKQLNSSKLLNTAGEKEQQLFFNKITHKIDALSQLINASTILNFE